MRKFALAFTALIASSGGSLAESGNSTLGVKCLVIADTVAQRGAVILEIDGNKFDRYVRDQSECSLGEVIAPAWIQSADNANCFIGYTCDQFHD